MAVLGDSYLKAHCLGWYHNDPCYIYIRDCFDLAGFRLSTQSALLLSPSQCAWWLWCASSLRKNNNPFRFCDCVLRQRIVAYSSCIEHITYIDTRTSMCCVCSTRFQSSKQRRIITNKGPQRFFVHQCHYHWATDWHGTILVQGPFSLSRLHVDTIDVLRKLWNFHLDFCDAICDYGVNHLGFGHLGHMDVSLGRGFARQCRERQLPYSWWWECHDASAEACQNRKRRLFDSSASSANPKKNSRNCRDVSLPIWPIYTHWFIDVW